MKPRFIETDCPYRKFDLQWKHWDYARMLRGPTQCSWVRHFSEDEGAVGPRVA